MFKQFRFPQGKYRTLTFSYDDGIDHDRRLIDMFNKAGVKGTFHLNANSIGQNGFVTRAEIPSLYKGHEVAIHGFTHPLLDTLPSEVVLKEILDDRRTLEDIVQYPVKGMSYPYGTFNKHVIDLIRSCGILYSRGVDSTNSFKIPENWFNWCGTCHHNADLSKLCDGFLNDCNWHQKPLRVFYVWGHSFEFDRNNNWEHMQAFLDKVSGKDNVWYATNIEIYDYLDAVKQVRFSVDCKQAYNPTAHELWFDSTDGVISIKPGETIILK